MVERIWLMSISTLVGGMVASMAQPGSEHGGVPVLLMYAGGIGMVLTVVLAALLLASRIAAFLWAVARR